MKKFLVNNQDRFYFVFRVLVGLLFFLHGWMKVSGIMSGSMSAMSLMGLAALIEVVGGVFFVIGFWVRPMAAISAVEMVFAYFMAHAGEKLSPLANNGEPAVLFFAAFLVLAGFGARKWAVSSD